MCWLYFLRKGATKKQIHSEFEGDMIVSMFLPETYIWLDNEGHGKNGAPYENGKSAYRYSMGENELAELAYIFIKLNNNKQIKHLELWTII